MQLAHGRRIVVDWRIEICLQGKANVQMREEADRVWKKS